MSSLVSALQRFNRKERSWLIRDALGAGADTLCPDFRERLAKTLQEYDREISIPPDAWWTTDFHIDWLIGALMILAESEDAVDTAKANPPGFVTGSQQDIDLLIAWDTTLILVEAKGVGSWSGTGTREKLARLAGLPGTLFTGLTPYLVFSSPDDRGVPKTGLPLWIKNREAALHMPMIPPETGLPLLKVQRCEVVGAKIIPKAGGTQWRILKARQPEASGAIIPNADTKRLG